MPPSLKVPKVFISYSHDSPEHMDRVLIISNRLREDGIDCTIDQYEISPPKGWPRWTAEQIEHADFVLVVCTEKYSQRFRVEEGTSVGLGVKWEGSVITQDLYDAETHNTKFIPVVFTPQDTKYIPTVLRGATRYEISTKEGYKTLYRHLTNQHSVLKPKLGNLRPMPPLTRKQKFPTLEAEHRISSTARNAALDNAQVKSPLELTSPINPAVKGRYQAIGSWVFGSILLLFFFWIFIFAPDSLPIYKQRMLAIISALLCGLFAFFLTGDVGLRRTVKSSLGELALRATGGVAILLLVLWWWLSSYSPVAINQPTVDTHKEVKADEFQLIPLSPLPVKTKVNAVALSQDGRVVAAAEDDGRVHVLRANLEPQPRELRSIGSLVTKRCIAVSPDGMMVAAGDDEGKIKLWRLDHPDASQIDSHSDWVFEVRFSPDGQKLASAGVNNDKSKSVRLWNISGEAAIKTFNTPDPSDLIISISADLQMMAIYSSPHHRIELWSLTENRQLRVFEDSEISVRGGAFSLDGRILVAGTAGGNVRIWQTLDGKMMTELKGLNKEPKSVTCGPDGKLIAVGYPDGAIYLWSMAESNSLQTPREFEGKVLSVAFSNDGHILAAGGVDGIAASTIPLTSKADRLYPRIKLMCM